MSWMLATFEILLGVGKQRKRKVGSCCTTGSETQCRAHPPGTLSYGLCSCDGCCQPVMSKVVHASNALIRCHLLSEFSVVV